ncbi:putative Alpha/Beta hydrolase protein [Seiridium cardinale]|uniref:Carboxylic ester hydrolase n=1 Tax=Seiridium cardinale TaxID=138064 RepID=A0ABR2XMK2_9PEZI
MLGVRWTAAACLVATGLGCKTHLPELEVDLGYGVYEGYYNDTFDLNIWKSIRYAAPPTGKLRWQAPEDPPTNRSGTIPATEQPPICPQTGAYGVPDSYGFTSGYGDEDCLYLNIYSAPNASALPVLVWIHGGGYSKFGAVYDPSVWINTNDNGFIVVEIQYRLGAFGFLASSDIQANGVLNAGLLDQRFALEWVQKHIDKFGGDPSRVTIGGESSGAGSVMYHALAYGGTDVKLFNNIIAASPYTPPVYKYDDTVPTTFYDAFVDLVGCRQNVTYARNYTSVFQCLVNTDTLLLQNASGTVSTTYGYFGSFAFLPVIDGDYVWDRPSQQLQAGKVNGKRILVGNNANDGVPLTNPDVDTFLEYDEFIANTFPLFNTSDVSSLNSIYQLATAQEGDDAVRFDTLGDSGRTALTVSEMATGLQQTVFDIAAESVFDCPAQWLAEAFGTNSHRAWKYQYSVTPAYHGADLSAYFAVGATVPNEDFRTAFQKMWGNFIIYDAPVISIEDATAGYPNATAPVGENGQIDWPAFTLSEPWQLDLNTTGGSLTQVTVTPNLSYYERLEPGIVNKFRLVNALSWEGGRGSRCNFWRNISSKVPF